MQDVTQIWSQVMRKLGASVPEKDLACWLGSIRPLAWEANRFVAELPSGIHRDRVRRCFHDGIRRALQETVGGCPEVVYAVRSRPFVPPAPAEPRRRKRSMEPGYSFESFVIGTSNEEAFQRARRMASSNLREPLTLLLCGGVGLGKTHLLHAIEREVRRTTPSARVEALSAERFVNEVVEACRGGRRPDVRKRLEGLDVLFLDDVQFVAGKRRSQEELADVLDELRRRKRRVVLASDRRPSQLSALDGRIRSHLDDEAIVEIRRPEARLRARILQVKAQASGFELAADVARWIASRIVTNVRELEGALTRLIAVGEMVGALPDLAFARRVLEPILPKSRRSGTSSILEGVAEGFQVTPEALRSGGRGGPLLARRTAMYLLRRGTETTYGEIGRVCGGRTASAVLQAVRTIERKRSGDSQFDSLITDLETNLGIL